MTVREARPSFTTGIKEKRPRFLIGAFDHRPWARGSGAARRRFLDAARRPCPSAVC